VCGALGVCPGALACGGRLAPRTPINVRRLGWSEVGLTAAFVLLLIVSSNCPICFLLRPHFLDRVRFGRAMIWPPEALCGRVY